MLRGEFKFNQIMEAFYDVLKANASPPKILYFDIETSHAVAVVWGGHKQYVSHEQIVKDRKILSIGYMWDTDTMPTILRLDLDKHDLTKFDDDADKQMLIDFMKIYSQADLAVAHNGRRFDIARIRARLVKHKLPDIKPILFDDSYGICKDIGFTFHKLDFLGKSLGYGGKKDAKLKLWIDIIFNKSSKSLQELCTYMGRDVTLLRTVYRRLRKYGKSSLNQAVFYGIPSLCPFCGSSHVHSNGYKLTRRGKHKQYQCRECHKYSTVGTNEIKKPGTFNR